MKICIISRDASKQREPKLARVICEFITDDECPREAVRAMPMQIQLERKQLQWLLKNPLSSLIKMDLLVVC